MPRRLKTLNDIERRRGEPVRISRDGGKSWYYAMVLDEPRQDFADSDGRTKGYDAADEVKNGVGGTTGITAKRLKDPNFLVEAVSASEVRNVRWSWPLGRR